jgi:hypothetical protein
MHNLFEVEVPSVGFPKVASRNSQPWALLRNLFEVKNRPDPESPCTRFRVHSLSLQRLC